MLRAGVKEQILKSALEGYNLAGGAHLPLDTSLLVQAANKQLGFARKFEFSDAELDPVRASMYAREAAHIGHVAGEQQAMRERGARRWRRVLHPELSKTGPCEACTADAELTHPIDQVFWEPHPLGVCSVQGIVYDLGPDSFEMPVPGESKPAAWEGAVRKLFEKIKSVVRRIRK
jgi:hypothetical protein